MFRLSAKFIFRAAATSTTSATCSRLLNSSVPKLELSAVASRQLSISSRQSADKISVTFNTTEGDSYQVWASEGESLLDVVINKDIPLDGFGACEGTLACSTCHVIVPVDVFDQLPEACEEELDMLDLAQDLTDHSRLGCQIILKPEHNGLEVTIPSAGRDARTL